MAPGSTTDVLEPALERLPGIPSLPPAPPWNELERGRPTTLSDGPPVSNARLAMLIFIVFESMIFVALIGAYIVLRGATRTWPPAGQPYLPIGMTWVNTFVLLGSFVPLAFAARSVRRGRSASFARGLAVAAGMGAFFLVVQGLEWTRLLAHGLTVSGGIYGGLFVALIGTHAVHVLGAVIWLATVAVLAAAGRIGAPGRETTSFELCTMYWAFVCILWIVLFGVVYLV